MVLPFIQESLVSCVRSVLHLKASQSIFACPSLGCMGGLQRRSAHGNLSHVKWCDCCGALDVLWLEAQRCSLAVRSRSVVTGTVSLAPLAHQYGGVCSHHAQEVSRVFHDSRWRQAWKRPRPSGGCDRAAKWRSICGDRLVLLGRFAQLTHAQ